MQGQSYGQQAQHFAQAQLPSYGQHGAHIYTGQPGIPQAGMYIQPAPGVDPTGSIPDAVFSVLKSKDLQNTKFSWTARDQNNAFSLHLYWTREPGYKVGPGYKPPSSANYSQAGRNYKPPSYQDLNQYKSYNGFEERRQWQNTMMAGEMAQVEKDEHVRRDKARMKAFLERKRAESGPNGAGSNPSNGSANQSNASHANRYKEGGGNEYRDWADRCYGEEKSQLERDDQAINTAQAYDEHSRSYGYVTSNGNEMSQTPGHAANFYSMDRQPADSNEDELCFEMGHIQMDNRSQYSTQEHSAVDASEREKHILEAAHEWAKNEINELGL